MKSVVICGSQRFNDEMNRFAARLKKLGIPLVLTPNFKYLRKDFTMLDEKERLTSKSYRKQIPALVLQHFDRILDRLLVEVTGAGHLGIREAGHLPTQAEHGGLMSQAGAGRGLVESGHQGLLSEKIGVFSITGNRLQFFGNLENPEELLSFEVLQR